MCNFKNGFKCNVVFNHCLPGKAGIPWLMSSEQEEIIIPTKARDLRLICGLFRLNRPIKAGEIIRKQ